MGGVSAREHGGGSLSVWAGPQGYLRGGAISWPIAGVVVNPPVDVWLGLRPVRYKSLSACSVLRMLAKSVCVLVNQEAAHR